MCTNLCAELTADSVAAPGDNEARWLPYAPAIVRTGVEDGTITCRLCRRCSAALSKTAGILAKPAATMPSEARAHGLWRGPAPPEIMALSYNEAKAINLARIYASVREVVLGGSGSYARTSASEAPLYHQNFLLRTLRTQRPR